MTLLNGRLPLSTYARILLKLSGEALAGEKKTGFDEATCMEVA